MELVLALQGRRGEIRIRGRALAAFADPSSLRLVGLAPFGAPGFVMVAQPETATLVLPRDRRIVTAAASDLLEVLAGIALGPDDFRALLTGCVVPDPRPVGAKAYGNGWIGVDLNGGSTVFLQTRDDPPLVVAGTRGGIVVEYAEHTRGLPRHVRVEVRATGEVVTGLTATLSQVNINTPVPSEAFIAQAHDDYLPMTLDELRRRAPLEDGAVPASPDF